MKKLFYPLAAAAIALAALTVVDASPVAALTVSTVTASTTAPVAGELVTFDASTSVCDVAPCQHQWSEVWVDSRFAMHTITQLGYGTIITTALGAMPAGAKYVVVLDKMTNSSKQHGTSTGQVALIVSVSPPP